MSTNKKVDNTQTISRRKFTGTAGILAAALALFAGFSFRGRKKIIIECKPETIKKKVRMLTEDGKLVEIDASVITEKGKKITDSELQNWVNR